MCGQTSVPSLTYQQWLNKTIGKAVYELTNRDPKELALSKTYVEWFIWDIQNDLDDLGNNPSLFLRSIPFRLPEDCAPCQIACAKAAALWCVQPNHHCNPEEEKTRKEEYEKAQGCPESRNRTSALVTMSSLTYQQWLNKIIGRAVYESTNRDAEELRKTGTSVGWLLWDIENGVEELESDSPQSLKPVTDDLYGHDGLRDIKQLQAQCQKQATNWCAVQAPPCTIGCTQWEAQKCLYEKKLKCLENDCTGHVDDEEKPD